MQNLCTTSRIIVFGTAFNSLRMLVGAFSAIYLLNRGLSLTDLGMLKTLQAAVILCSDIPLAYISDRYSRKLSISISVLFGSLWLLLTGYGTQTWVFYLAEFCNAISLALISGAFLSYLIDSAQSHKLPVHAIIGRSNKYKFLGMAVASVSGSLLAGWSSPSGVWILAGFSCLFMCVLTWALPPDNHQKKTSEQKSVVNDLLLIKQELLKSRVIVYGAILLIIVSLYYQVIIQFWQPWAFQSSRNAWEYGFLFGCILMAQSLSGKIAGKTKDVEALFKKAFSVSLLSVAILGFQYFNSMAIPCSIVVMFSGVGLLINATQGFFHSHIESSNRATVDSIISTVMRLVLLLVMPLVAFAIERCGWHIMPLGLCSTLILSGAVYKALFVGTRQTSKA